MPNLRHECSHAPTPVTSARLAYGRPGQIALAGALSNSTISNNTFYDPLYYSLYLGVQTYTYSNVAITNTITYWRSDNGYAAPKYNIFGNK
jgi:hypothetical protein